MADLVLVEARQALARLEGLLHRPSPSSHLGIRAARAFAWNFPAWVTRGWVLDTARTVRRRPAPDDDGPDWAAAL